MTQEDKDHLLLRDLCARLSYGVIVEATYKDGEGWKTNDRKLLGVYADGQVYLDGVYTDIGNIKPYLRSISSMSYNESNYYNIYIEELSLRPNIINAEELIAWLLKNHFDYHNLIPMGLALEAPEDMYKS